MTPKITLLTSILILQLPAITAHADNSTTATHILQGPDTSIEPTSQPANVQNLEQARKQIEQLQFNMLELQTILAQKPQNITLIKTKTSWIRKLLTSLHSWSLNQATTDKTEKLFNKFCWIISDMEEEVMRDDMLDSVELQALSINYTQLENTLSQIENSENTTPPFNSKPE